MLEWENKEDREDREDRKMTKWRNRTREVDLGKNTEREEGMGRVARTT